MNIELIEFQITLSIINQEYPVIFGLLTPKGDWDLFTLLFGHPVWMQLIKHVYWKTRINTFEKGGVFGLFLYTSDQIGDSMVSGFDQQYYQ